MDRKTEQGGRGAFYWIARALQLALAALIVWAIVAYLQPESRDWWTASTLPWMSMMLAGRVALFGCGIALVEVLCRLLRAVHSHYTPFTAANTRRLRTAALLIFGMEAAALALRFFISQGIVYTSRYASYMIGAEDAMPIGPADVVLLVVGVAVFCLASVFRRGEALQQESDETL